MRYLPLHPLSAGRIHLYQESSGHRHNDKNVPLFKFLQGKSTGTAVSANGIYTLVEAYAKKAGMQVPGLGVHGPRAAAATNALEREADIAKVQAWLGHANISTIKIYDRRQNRPEDSPNV